MDIRAFLAAGAIGLLTGAPARSGDYPFPPPVAHEGAQVSVFATGLKDPRGMAIAPDGDLYVAEAGTTRGIFVPPPPPVPGPATRTRCEVFWPVGPATPGYTSRISRIGRRGQPVPIVEHIPSMGSNTLVGGDRQGATALTFVGNQLFAVTAGAGCSHGHSEPNQLMWVFRSGFTFPLADLSSFLRNTVDSKNPADGDFEADGVWFNLIHTLGAFYSVEPNHGTLVRISHWGQVTLVADMIAKVAEIDPAHDGDKTFTAFTRHGAWFYMGTLGRIDADFAAEIYRVSLDGRQVKRVASGLHGVVGIAFDKQDRMYALETTRGGVAPPLSDPSAGRLVRVERNGSLTPIVSNLPFPIGLKAGRRGEFYVSTCSYHCDDQREAPAVLSSLEAGQILKVTLARAESWCDDED